VALRKNNCTLGFFFGVGRTIDMQGLGFKLPRDEEWESDDEVNALLYPEHFEKILAIRQQLAANAAAAQEATVEQAEAVAADVQIEEQVVNAQVEAAEAAANVQAEAQKTQCFKRKRFGDGPCLKQARTALPVHKTEYTPEDIKRKFDRKRRDSLQGSNQLQPIPGIGFILDNLQVAPPSPHVILHTQLQTAAVERWCPGEQFTLLVDYMSAGFGMAPFNGFVAKLPKPKKRTQFVDPAQCFEQDHFVYFRDCMNLIREVQSTGRESLVVDADSAEYALLQVYKLYFAQLIPAEQRAELERLGYAQLTVQV
jgi:hypothetical protein